MKLALLLLTAGIFMGLVFPYYWGGYFSAVQVELPKLIWSRSPPRVFEFSLTSLFRITGFLLIVVGVLRFVFSRHDG